MYLDMQVDLCSRELGPNHRATLRNLTNHAIALSKLGELQRAEAELTEVITRLNTLGDGDAGLLLTARLWHHHVLRELGWVAETAADARFAADSYARQLGPDHSDTLHWRELTAVGLWEAGRHDEARAEMADVAARQAATQGPEHPDTLTARASLAHRTGEAGDAAGARDQYAALLPSRERAQGFDHPDTLTARAWLAYWTKQAKATGPDARLLIAVTGDPGGLPTRALTVSNAAHRPLRGRLQHRHELSRSGEAEVLRQRHSPCREPGTEPMMRTSPCHRTHQQ